MGRLTRAASAASLLQLLFRAQGLRKKGQRSATCGSQWDAVACAGTACHTCGGRISWVVDNLDKSWEAAGQHIAEEFPDDCGACGGCASQWGIEACAGSECFTCGSRIEWVVSTGESWGAAAQQVADEFPDKCGACGGWPATGPSPSPPAPTPGEFTLRMIPNAEQRLALCNDGSHAGFYYAPPDPSLAEDPPVWSLYQEGGNWCWDDDSCNSRRGDPSNPSTLVSSINWPQDESLDGFFRQGRLGASAHRVYMRYCTSDGYIGNRTGPLGWHFRGRPVLAAIVEEMVLLGMGSVADTRLLYGGCSAGGRGASYAIDWLHTLLPSTVSLRGYFDSPLWVDLDPLYGGTGLAAQSQAIAALHGSNLDETCVEAYADEPWRCLMGETGIQHVEVPSLVFVHQDDSFQLAVAGIAWGGQPSTQAEWDWWGAFRTRTRDALNALPSRHAVFSIACYGHCISYGSEYNNMAVTGVTLQNAVEQLLFDDTAVRAMQDCRSFACCTDS